MLQKNDGQEPKTIDMNKALMEITVPSVIGNIITLPCNLFQNTPKHYIS